jgi:hypothetical protein
MKFFAEIIHFGKIRAAMIGGAAEEISLVSASTE